MAMAKQFAGKRVAMTSAGRLQEGNSGLPVSGLRRDLQRVGAWPPLRTADEARSSISVASEGRILATPGRVAEPPEMFEMDIGSMVRVGEPDMLGECAGNASDTCSETSTENSLQLRLADFMDTKGGGRAQEKSQPPVPFPGLVRNLSGHLPVTRPSNGGPLKTKAYGNLMRSLSGHRPKSSRDRDADRISTQGGLLKDPFAPILGQFPQRVDGKTLQRPVKCYDVFSTKPCASLPQMARSGPVAVPQRGRKPFKLEDEDDDDAFVPPHVFLSRKELKKNPSQAEFANPSAGRLKGIPSLRFRNLVLKKTGFFDGYTEMWQCPEQVSSEPVRLF